ncbi:MAG: argininosuccinate synthase [Chloroflexi bacterium]|nr:argininosuccinate synthase [Chloroflexota bacterium]
MAERVVLAYSGGLDTSVAIKWIAEKYGMDVIALTVDLGNARDLEAVRQKALRLGAINARVVDARESFVREFIFPALQADAVYEGQYPLATALGRPLIVRLCVEAAREERARAIAHGSTGKGNDQVRFDVGVAALAPDIRIVAPAREWGMTREQTIEYAMANNIPIPITVGRPYSIDENLWGRSIECGVLEDPWAEPPEDVFSWTKPVKDAPEKPQYVEIGFEAGIPVSLDEEPMDGVSLIRRVTELAGEHGVGRIDHVENRLVGIKSREVYEAPAATVLLKAHQALEALTLSKAQLRFKDRVAAEYADLVYNGLWFTALHQDLAAYVRSSQRHVSGAVRMKLHKGSCSIAGRKSARSLYSFSLATYDKGDAFDPSASVGFIKIYGLPVKVQAQTQLLSDPSGLPGLEGGHGTPCPYEGDPSGLPGLEGGHGEATARKGVQ